MRQLYCRTVGWQYNCHPNNRAPAWVLQCVRHDNESKGGLYAPQSVGGSDFGRLVVVARSTGIAQVRVVPEKAAGGEPQGEPWADVPETFRHLKFPDWPVPTDLSKWQTTDRLATRATVLRLLGEMPARPDPAKVKVRSTEDKGTYVLERFEFHNGVDMVVPGVLLVPKKRSGPAPAILALHGRGSSKESVCTELNEQSVRRPDVGRERLRGGGHRRLLERRAHRHGARPASSTTARPVRKLTPSKLYLWQGRTLWGMMLRDEQCLIDYLATRPEVDKQRIGATGMSMGCTRSWWLAAIDDRVKAIVGVACFTRYCRPDRARQPPQARHLLLRARHARPFRYRGDLRPGGAAAHADALGRPGRRRADRRHRSLGTQAGAALPPVRQARPVSQRDLQQDGPRVPAGNEGGNARVVREYLPVR